MQASCARCGTPIVMEATTSKRQGRMYCCLNCDLAAAGIRPPANAPLCANCGVPIAATTTLVAQDGETYCCENCAAMAPERIGEEGLPALPELDVAEPTRAEVSFADLRDAGTRVNPDTLEPYRQRDPVELEPDFNDPVDSSAIDVSEVSNDDVYFPPTDPVVRPAWSNSREGLQGTFESDSMADDVEPQPGSPMRGDEALAGAIRIELRQDAATADLPIEVKVENRVARLSGQVSSIEDAENAEEVAGRIAGVLEVVDELEVSG